jgi:hypothetical protein
MEFPRGARFTPPKWRIKAGRRELHSVLGDGIAAGHRELVDAAIGLAFDADDLIELGGVEIDRRRGGRGGTRLPPASTTAMFMGWPSSCALTSAAAIT